MFSESSIIRVGYKTQSNLLETAINRLTNNIDDLIIDENDFIGFLFKAVNRIDIKFLRIILGEFEFNLLLIGEIDGIFYYTAAFDDIYPEESNFWHSISSPFNIKLAKILLNNIGILIVSILDLRSNDILKIGTVEVISNKLDQADISDMFDYLLGKNVSYWNPFALTIHQNENKPLRLSFFLLIAQLEKDIKTIDGLVQDFIANPISTLSSKYATTDFDERHIMDDNSIQWLFSNLDVLEKTNLVAESTVKINNSIYTASGMLTKNFYNNTDIYENQIIIGFFIDLMEVLTNHIKNIYLRLNLLKDDEVVTGKFSIIKIQEKKFLERQERLAKDVINCTTIIHQTFLETFLVKFPLSEAPKPENKFESKEHYLIIHNIISRWYDYKDLSWGTNELFGGIRTLDKLYELFCLYKLIDLIKDIGFKEPKTTLDQNFNFLDESNHVGIYDFGKSIDNKYSIRLFYEKLPDELCTIIPTFQGRELRPDFIIEISDNKGTKYVILDAKFKKVKNIKKFTFQELIPKYLHGIGKVDGHKAIIVGLLLLFPEDKTLINHWKIDFHKNAYSIDGNKTTYPIISAIEVPLDKQRKMNLKEIIKRLILN